ncbi:SDR family NAD(P)-dependent oxidoreductase [Mycobacterium colombiense]|uniref:SDR family NAD(P)-dependent oxidoreductase n=1 Tax=Mycobacterium colombiense TaxID=339268 RepID=UPI0007FC82E4|nr:SDR family oxidoreductase [Mycobacterium colombiense]OBJ24437.1 ketoreductase [Mycobacterium colombiense]
MTPTTHRLADRTVIVTGAGSGIGRATAVACAQVGAYVLAVGRREANLRDTANTHPAIAPFVADICADGAPEAVIDEAIGRWGRIDVLVNNAGAAAIMTLPEVTGARIAELFALNVTAPSLLARAALPYLREVHGSIVNVSSTFGHRPLPGGSHYAASKSAIEMLTQSWALELAEGNVRVNAVAPGPTESEALAASGLPGAAVDKIKQNETERIPLGRRGKPEDIASWIVHLADPASTWLTGQILTVDGGLELT